MSEKGPLSPEELSQDLNANKSYKKEAIWEPIIRKKCLAKKGADSNLEIRRFVS